MGLAAVHGYPNCWVCDRPQQSSAALVLQPPLLVVLQRIANEADRGAEMLGWCSRGLHLSAARFIISIVATRTRARQGEAEMIFTKQ